MKKNRNIFVIVFLVILCIIGATAYVKFTSYDSAWV